MMLKEAEGNDWMLYYIIFIVYNIYNLKERINEDSIRKLRKAICL